MGSKTPNYRGKKKRPNRPKTQSNPKGSTNPPGKSTNDNTTPVTPQPKSNDDSNGMAVTTTSPPHGTTMTTSVTPMTKNPKSPTTDKSEKPLTVIQDGINDFNKTNNKPTTDNNIIESSYSAVLQSESSQDSDKSTFLLQK